jgi:glycosyltransferase involved in cell wall biosynthesis
MKIVHIVPALFGSGGAFGGAERYVFEMARFMSERVPTTLLSFGDKAETRQEGALRIRVLGNPCHVRGQCFNPLHAGIVGEVLRADVVHCHQQHVLASSLAALLSRCTLRRVFTTDLGGGGWDISGYISTDRFFHGHLHISEYSRKIFNQENWPRAKVILGGVDTLKFAPANEPCDGVVRFVGRLMPHKGVDVLIRALPPGMRLDLIGRRHNEEYQKHLLELAHGKAVRFLHDYDDTAMISAYQRALCVVLPSVYRDCYGHESRIPELLGQTLLEGMSCGIPGICSDVASMPEIVQNDVTGFVVPPNDPDALGRKLLWLREHPAEAQEMGRRSRQRVLDYFTWPRVVERCLEAYQSV